MYKIPIFPLNTVLFPGMPLPLQIFEERYKEMVAMCIREKRPFGVVLIREGVAEMGPLAEPYEIGCTAEITQVQPLDDSGRMLILTVGQERFRIVSLHHDKPYLTGTVEALPLKRSPEEVMETAADELYPLVLEYLQILARAGKVDFDTTQIPTEPEALVFLAAGVIQLDSEDKQDLLAMHSVLGLMRRLRHIYRGELPILRLMPPEDQGIFSLS